MATYTRVRSSDAPCKSKETKKRKIVVTGGDDLTRRARSTHWMHLIQSSFSSSVEADILYTVCFPSTTWAKIGVNKCDVLSLN